jgi:hypothetical protein
MKPDQDDRLEARDFFTQPRECSAESLHPPEIVGEVGNPVLETARRLWWRAFDHVCSSGTFQWPVKRSSGHIGLSANIQYKVD